VHPLFLKYFVVLYSRTLVERESDRRGRIEQGTIGEENDRKVSREGKTKGEVAWSELSTSNFDSLSAA
jgi:hypothetical protein